MINITITLSDLQKEQEDIFDIVTQPYPIVTTALTTADATTYINDKISASKTAITDFITQFTGIKDYDNDGFYINYTNEILNIQIIKRYVVLYTLYLIFWDLFVRKSDLKPLVDLEERERNSNYERFALHYESFIRNPETKKMNNDFLNLLNQLTLSNEVKPFSLLRWGRG